MDIAEQQQGAVLVVKPSGPLTGDGAARLRVRFAQLTKATLGRLVLDVSDVPFLDSKGVEALLDCADDISSLGHGLKLCGTNQTVAEVLRITGHFGTFEFHHDTQAGVRSFL